MDIKQLYRQVIMEHYKHPLNKGLVNDDKYLTIHLHNPSCGDDIKVQLLTENDLVKDIKHEGSGCSICCASASIMSQTLMNQKIDQAQAMVNEFYELVKGNNVDESILTGEALVYQTVHQFPARIKCATLAWKALEEGLKQTKES
jgi:nitrogen fixation NifU-like protein